MLLTRSIGSIGSTGGWCEVAYVIADAFQHFRIDQPINYIRVTIAADYNFNSKTYGFVEYHFSSTGAIKPECYLVIFKNSALSKGGIYLMVRHYLIPGMNYQLTPLINTSGQFLIHISDRSLFAAPQLEYNICENIYLSAGVFLGLGSQPVLRVDTGLLLKMTFQSEFGGYPEMYFTSFRIYF